MVNKQALRKKRGGGFWTLVGVEATIGVGVVIGLFTGSGMSRLVIVSLSLVGGLAILVMVINLTDRGDVAGIRRLLRILVWGAVVAGVMTWVGYTVWPKPIASSAGSLVQFDHIMDFPAKDLKVGQSLHINYDYMNAGIQPAMDVQSWGAVLAIDPSKNPNDQLRRVVNKGLVEGYEKFHEQGGGLEVNAYMWSTAVSYPLTLEQVDMLNSGIWKMYLILDGAWTDQAGQRYYWQKCEWVDWKQYTQQGIPVYHVC